MTTDDMVIEDRSWVFSTNTVGTVFFFVPFFCAWRQVALVFGIMEYMVCMSALIVPVKYEANYIINIADPKSKVNKAEV